MKNTFRLPLSLLSFFAFIMLFAGCFKSGGRCEEMPHLGNSAIQVSFKDNATGKYLYTNTNPLYNIDSIKVYDENNNSLSLLKAINNIPNSTGGYWEVNFGNIYNPQTDVFNSDLCRNFIVKYTYNEVDTIKACFKAKETKCGSEFEYLKIYYKGELVGTTTHQASINLIINKK